MENGIVEGQVLAGKYRIEHELGRGGMGVVVAARHLVLQEPVAIKFLSPKARESKEAVARFEREARAAWRIRSEHVVRVMDVARTDSGEPYMVMELLEGQDLSSWIRTNGPLPVELAVDFVLQACVAVADAHGLGIIHRDLKPSNLFCIRRSDGRQLIKVLDFGISKLTDSFGGSDSSMSVTNTAAVMGSPLYMSPEQVQSAKDVDARSDIWSLGVVLFELLTGDVPFMGQAFGELAVKISVQKAPPLSSLRSDVPAGLEAAIAKCLEKSREGRYHNVAELANALLPFASKRSSEVVEQIAGIIRGAGMSASVQSLPPARSPLLPAALPPLLTPTPAAPSEPPEPAAHAGDGGPAAQGATDDGLERPIAVPRVQQTVATWSRPPRETSLGTKTALGVAAAIGIGLLLVFTLLIRRPSPPTVNGAVPSADERAAESATAPSSAIAPAPRPAAFVSERAEPSATPRPSAETRSVPPQASASAAPPKSASPPAPPFQPVPVPPIRSNPSLGSPLPAPATVRKPAKPNCDPPFTTDERGRKRFKPECF